MGLSDPAELGSAYDALAPEYDERFADSLRHQPHDRAMLAMFAELLTTRQLHPRPRVLDVGCGSGRITGHLADAGLEVRGLDLSPGMLAIGRDRRPDLDLRQGDLRDPAALGSRWDGIVAFYSLIHLDPDQRPAALATLVAALRPGGLLLTAFQVGSPGQEPLRVRGMDFHRLDPDEVSAELGAVGAAERARLVREPEGDEATRHAYLLMARTGPGRAVSR